VRLNAAPGPAPPPSALRAATSPQARRIRYSPTHAALTREPIPSPWTTTGLRGPQPIPQPHCKKKGPRCNIAAPFWIGS